jgi:hypothetical protein
MGFIANIRDALHITDGADKVDVLKDAFGGTAGVVSDELNQTVAGADMEVESDKKALHEPEPPTQRPVRADTFVVMPPQPRVKVLTRPVKSVRVYIDGREIPENVEFETIWST